MPTKTPSKSSIAWTYYLHSLWLIAIIFLGIIIYGYIGVKMEGDRNPASGLAIIGVFVYFMILAAFCAFVLLNTYIRKKIGHSEKASWRFLIISWICIGITMAISTAIIIQGIAAQNYYEKNVLPKTQICYKNYLDGRQASPHCEY